MDWDKSLSELALTEYNFEMTVTAWVMLCETWTVKHYRITNRLSLQCQKEVMV